MKPETKTSERPLFFSLEVYDKEKTQLENFQASEAYKAISAEKAAAPLAQIWVAFEAPYHNEFFTQVWRNEDGKYVYPEATEEYEVDVSKTDEEGKPVMVKETRKRIPAGKGDELTSTLFGDFPGFACPFVVMGRPDLSCLGPVHAPSVDQMPKLRLVKGQTKEKLTEKFAESIKTNKEVSKA
jgi:hypothetical protein